MGVCCLSVSEAWDWMRDTSLSQDWPNTQQIHVVCWDHGQGWGAVGFSGLCHQGSLHIVTRHRSLLRISLRRADNKGSPNRPWTGKSQMLQDAFCITMSWTSSFSNEEGQKPCRRLCTVPNKSRRLCALLMGRMQLGKVSFLWAGSHSLHLLGIQTLEWGPAVGRRCLRVLVWVRLLNFPKKHSPKA